MVDALVVKDISDDVNFVKLTNDGTETTEFTQLLEEHVQGYSQKKRLVDGLKEYAKKVEEAENRLIVAKNVGKFKGPDPEDAKLTNSSSSYELKQKVQIVNSQLDSMISEGSITHAEKPQVQENLQMRLAKAKEAGKEKLEGKLEQMSAAVQRAQPFTLPLKNIEQFHQLDKELRAIAKLEKLPAKSLTVALRDRIEKKTTIEENIDALMDASRMWFETPVEFKPRLDAAMAAYAANEEERIRQEEEEAFRKKIREEEEAVERKRQAAEKKRLEAEKALEEKLEAKRLEAAAKPVKEAPKKQAKEKKVVASVDLKHLFQDEISKEIEEREQVESEISNTAALQAEFEAEARRKEKEKQIAELKQAVAEAEAAKRERHINETKAAKIAEKEKLAKVAALKAAAKTESKPAAKESKWLEPAKATKTAEEKQAEEEKKFKAIEEKLQAKRLEAEAKPKKEVQEPPKKKEKTVQKMSLLDFYGEDSVLEKLAAQEAKEKLEREAAAKEAARLAAEQEAEEETLWAEQETAQVKSTAPTQVASISKTEPAKIAPKSVPKPKPKRKPPAEIESKWGATVVHTEMAVDEDGDMPFLAEALPSLQDSLTAPQPKKTPVPQPKKKEKKKWGKIDANLIGFDADNPNL